MLAFERTRDLELVRSIMTHPLVYPWIADDFAPAAEDFRPLDHPGVWYVLAFDAGELLGLWLFAPQNGVCWEVHTCLLPGHGYRRGREAARAMASWIFERTPCRRIVTTVPRNNRAAAIFAKAAGMKEFGINEMSFMKNGNLYDQILLGMSKPEAR